MTAYITRIGAWGRGFADWPELADLLRGKQLPNEPETALKPAAIPSNERRRAPFSAKLAVEVCTQATSDHPAAERGMASVFASGLGDTELTEYMCRELAGPEKQLSPTKFHNSVHNAPAGYWTIATGCTQPATAVAGLYRSVTEGLLEALVQCQTEGGPVLFVAYDTPATWTLSDLYPCDQPFAAAVVLESEQSASAEAVVEWAVEPAREGQWPDLELPDYLRSCYTSNIAARMLSVLAPLARRQASTVTLPLSGGTSLVLRLVCKDQNF